MDDYNRIRSDLNQWLQGEWPQYFSPNSFMYKNREEFEEWMKRKVASHEEQLKELKEAVRLLREKKGFFGRLLD